MQPLTQADYVLAARELGCSVAAIKAVAEVESAGYGFLPTGEPKILFEAHVFDRLTGGKYRKTHPNLSSAGWNRTLYGPAGKHQHQRLAAAAALDRDAALQSCSWGAFQLMGYHWKLLWYPTLQAFVNDMYDGEPGQLRAFVRFVKANKLDDDLRRLDWHGFSRGYNGPAYMKNRYAEKMEAAYARHLKLNPDFSKVTQTVTSTERAR